MSKIVCIKRPLCTNNYWRGISPFFFTYFCRKYLFQWVFSNSESLKGWFNVTHLDYGSEVVIGKKQWTCSHDTGHIWEAILPHPSESMSLILQALERQRSAVSLGINWLYWLILKALNDLTR
jgi:hypothetical protein